MADQLVADSVCICRLGCLGGEYQLVTVIISAGDRYGYFLAIQVSDIGGCDGKRCSFISE